MKPVIQRRLTHKQRKAKAKAEHKKHYRYWADGLRTQKYLYRGSYFK